MKLQLLTVFSLLQLSAGDPRLVCQETVKTRIGDNVVLRCHVEPEENIKHEEVEVTKVEPDALVYSYYNGRQLGDFYEPYRHRTFLNTKDLKIGVVNLKIFSVRKSDEGTYRIHISNRRITTLVTLIVGNPLLVCQEMVVAKMGHDVVLPCHLETKQSIVDDEVICRRSDLEVLVYARRNGEQLANLDQYRHRTSVNTEQLKNGVLNLKISSVRQSDKGTYKIYIPKWRIRSTVTLILGDPPPSGDPPSGDPPSGDPPSDDPTPELFALVLLVALGLVVGILVKREVTQRHSSQQDEDTELQETTAGNQNSQQKEQLQMISRVVFPLSSSTVT